MTNSTRVNELQDKILQAIDIISGQALNSISYDKTITCTIEDDKDKKEGKYIVSDGSSSFVAYGSDTNLRIGTPVYVTVPEGKFENQKLIVGKKTSEIEEPFLFTRPLDTMFAMEEIKVLVDDNNNTTSLLANGTEDEKEIYKQQVSYTNYTRLGIKADFSSWIPNAVEGNYGIAIVLNITNKDSIRAQEEAENEAKKDETELTEQKILYLDSSDMFGDPYNFVGDYEQQAVFALDDVTGTITHIKVCGYQLRNFKDIDSELIPYSEPQEDGLEISYLEPNIFIKNVELQLGYDISTFTKDYVEVYTPSGKSYKRSTNATDTNYITRNQKELNVRWVHVDKKNGPINMVNTQEQQEQVELASLMKSDDGTTGSEEQVYLGQVMNVSNPNKIRIRIDNEKLEEFNKVNKISTSIWLTRQLRVDVDQNGQEIIEEDKRILSIIIDKKDLEGQNITDIGYFYYYNIYERNSEFYHLVSNSKCIEYGLSMNSNNEGNGKIYGVYEEAPPSNGPVGKVVPELSEGQYVSLQDGIVIDITAASTDPLFFYNINRLKIEEIYYNDGVEERFTNLIIKTEDLIVLSEGEKYICKPENIIGLEDFLAIPGYEDRLRSLYTYSEVNVYGYYEEEIFPDDEDVFIGYTQAGYGSSRFWNSLSDGIIIELKSSNLLENINRLKIKKIVYKKTDGTNKQQFADLLIKKEDLIEDQGDSQIFHCKLENIIGPEDFEEFVMNAEEKILDELYTFIPEKVYGYQKEELPPEGGDSGENEGGTNPPEGGSGNEGGGGDSGETPPEGGDGNEGEDDEGTEAPRAQYEIRWYRYRVGAAAADQYSNIYWERMYVDENKILQPWTDDREESGCDTTTFTGLIFNPDVNRQQEKIKVIILYRESENNNPIPYYSKELILDNEEDLPPSQEAQHIANALVIRCDDGSNGNYFVYNQGGHITDKSLSDQTRTLSCLFDTDNDGEAESEINDDSRLIWTFPNEKDGGSMITGIKKAQSKVEYKIAQRYNSSYKNNVIRCSYNLNGVTYTAEKVLNFGTAGTMGTDYTLKIEFEDANKIAYTVNKDDNLSFILKMYDSVGNKLEIDENTIVEWSWYYAKNWTNNNALNLVTYKNDKLVLTNVSSYINIDTVLILQAKVEMLETYFPIPIRSDDKYKYIQGPTEVLYHSDGKVEYSKYNYKLFGEEVPTNITWEVYSAEDSATYINCGKITSTAYDLYTKGWWQKDATGEYVKSTTYNSQTTYYKKEDYLPTIKSDGTFSPLSFYIEGLPTYCVRAIDQSNNTIIWSQPILVCQNKYPSDAVNKWDGNSLVLNEVDSTIHSAAISAGKKNSDNTFSGVMMGNWEGKLGNESSISKHTGIYGFDKGVMAYALTDDGKAFFGKNGNGRIIIDGSQSTLYSPSYLSQSKGMMIDLGTATEAPYIDIKNSNSQIYLTAQNNGSYIELKNGENYIKISSKTGANDKPLQVNDSFYVNWNGSFYSEKGQIKSGTTNGKNTFDIYGQINLLDTTNDNILGYIGEMSTNKPGSYGLGTSGIGMASEHDSANNNGWAFVKVNEINSGIGFYPSEYVSWSPYNQYISQNSAYVSCSFYETTIGHGVSGGSAGYIRIIHPKHQDVQGSINKSYPVIQSNIPASNQFGIYARFA